MDPHRFSRAIAHAIHQPTSERLESDRAPALCALSARSHTPIRLPLAFAPRFSDAFYGSARGSHVT
jgi:hypothetical protein